MDKLFQENGISYVLACGNSTTGQAYSYIAASTSFNDCFGKCDQSSTSGGADYCSAFTYVGSADGSGPGTCYLFNGVQQGVAPASSYYVTAVRAVNYNPPAAGGAFSTTVAPQLTASTPSASAPGLSISLASLSAPQVSLSAPTLSASLSIPVDTNAGSSVVNDLSSGLGNVVGATSVPSTSLSLPSLSLSISNPVTLPLTLSVSGNGGLGVTIGSSTLGIAPSLSVGFGGGVGIGGGSGGSGSGSGSAGAPTASTSSGSGSGSSGSAASVTASPGSGSGSLSGASATSASSTSYYVTPMAPIVTTSSTASLSTGTTTVYTTSTVTSCLTGAGGVLTCPLGGLFTTLPSTSGAVTSVSTSVSVSVSYVTITKMTANTSSGPSTFLTASSTSTGPASPVQSTKCGLVDSLTGLCASYVACIAGVTC